MAVARAADVASLLEGHPDPRFPYRWSLAPWRAASLLAFRECSLLCSTMTISFAADITIFVGTAGRWRLHMLGSFRRSSPVRAFCRFLSPTVVLRGLAETH
jgi:hypothetical protein